MFKNKKIIVLLEVILIVLAIYKLVDIFGYFSENKKTDSINLEAKKLIEESLEIDKKEEKNKEGLTFTDKYPDAVGSIRIPGTNISNILVQGEDNSYYMDHSIDKSYNGNGSIFLDYRNKGLDDDNTIIYGHYIKSGKFFYDLDKFRNQDFYNSYNKIYIDRENAGYEYMVYSIYIAEPEENYREPNFESVEDKKKFLQDIRDKSIVKVMDFDFREEDAKILTLSTCSNRGEKRLVVHGIRLDK